MNTRILKIEGMSCRHCVMSVRKELSNIAGLTVESVEVGSAVVSSADPAAAENDIRAAVDRAGFTLSEIRTA